MSKRNESWDLVVDGLTPSTRRALQRVQAGPLSAVPPPADTDDDEDAYVTVTSRLTPKTRAAVAAATSLPVVIERNPQAEETMARFGMVTCPDGEWPTMSLFRDAEQLARRIGELQNTDTVVWAFYGLPLPVTEGPQRYLGLPGGMQMIQIPLFANGPAEVVRVTEVTTRIEQHGYLGPPEMAQSQPKVRVPAAVDEDDDEEDEG